MFSRFFRRPKSKTAAARSPMPFEVLESRTMLSAAPLAAHHPAPHHAAQHAAHQLSNQPGADVTPDLISMSPNGSTTYRGVGLTPAIIRTAYDFGTTGTEGAGQTIAIVDAYSDPNITSDLGVFDKQFNVAAPPSLKIVNQTGGAKLPAANAGWAQEISLDVEWAHAMAPAANILLVEANTNGTNDLMSAVNYAATKAPVVSMSWGSGEYSTENTYDASFAVPNVTFVASAGDTGGQREWPAESPNVLSVGGTTLSNSNGNYVSEKGWSSSGGGTSTVESAPAYQSANGVTYTNRSAPDVSYDADPNSGFAVYDSYRNFNQVGWQLFGGTSAGAPQWAALIATADQQRASAGKAALNSISDPTNADYSHSIQAAVYAMYSAKDANGNSLAYSNNDFHDVTSGSAGGNTATAGYDQVTGIGSPFSQNLIKDLNNNVA